MNAYIYLRALKHAEHTVFCVEKGQKTYYDPQFNRWLAYSSGQQVKRSILDALTSNLNVQMAPITFNYEIVTKNGNHPIDKKKAVQYIGESIQKFIYKNEQKRIGILLNTWLTNEELFLIKKIFIQEMKLENVFFTRRARGEKDDFLITEDRTPNTKGAEEIGFQFKEVEEGSLDGIELFIAFLSSPFDSEGSDELIPKLRNIKTKILFTPFQRKWNDAFDWVLPTTVSAERGGSFTNIDGRVQHFGPVLSPRGEAQAEWEWLVSLGNELDIDFEKTFGVSSPLDIFKILRDQIEFFQRIK